MSYQISQNGINFITANEGCKLVAYPDSNIPPVWTIGVGIIVYQNGVHVKQGDVITQEQSDSELMYQVGLKTHQLAPLIPPNLNQNQYDSLCDFVYNEGVTAFQGSTLRRLIHNNPNDPAITDAFKMWDKERKDGQLVFSQGIYDRRVRDAALYFS